MLLPLKRAHPSWLIVRCCFPCNYTRSPEWATVVLAVIHLTRRAQLWGTPEWEIQTSAWSTFASFVGELQKIFGNGGWRTQHSSKSLGYMPGRSDHHWQHHWFLARHSDWNSWALSAQSLSLVGVSQEYYDYREVAGAPSLPPHWDYTINLWEGDE